MKIYEFQSHQKFLKSVLRSEVDRGGKGRLARAAGCNPSWITRVLAEEVQLTPDQALGIAQSIHLNESETDYFMALVELQRSATPLLRERIQKKLKALRSESRNFGPIVRTDGTLSQEHYARYYSSWVYSALHMACMLPGSMPYGIATRFSLSQKTVNQVLLDLEEMGLISKQSGERKTTSKNIHLNSTDFLAVVGHRNWRERTIQYLQDLNSEGLHYSAIHTLSKNDIETIRSQLKDAILNCRKIIDESPAEALGVLCLDWYGL
jgi:uncharacterized protein (TIGR02147 family)